MADVSIRVDTRATYFELNGKSVWHTTPSGFEMVLAVMDYVTESHDLLIGRLTAEHLILSLGRQTEEVTDIVRGRDANDGQPKSALIATSEVVGAISDVLDELVETTEPNLIAKLNIALKGYQHDPFSREFLPEHITLRGEFKDVIELRNRLEAALGVPVIVGK